MLQHFMRASDLTITLRESLTLLMEVAVVHLHTSRLFMKMIVRFAKGAEDSLSQ